MSLPTSLWRGEGRRAVVGSVVVVVAAAAGAAVVIVIFAGWGASCRRVFGVGVVLSSRVVFAA
jgi:hypothetical protein